MSIYDLAQQHPHEDRAGLQIALDSLAEKGALKVVELQGIRQYRIR